MMPGSLIVNEPAWYLYGAGALVFAVGIAAWSYRAAPAGPVRSAGMALRTIALLLLTACLLEPLWNTQRARPGANLFAIAVDNSQSLGVKDTPTGPTRTAALQRELSDDPDGWLALLEHQFDLRRFFFDSRLQATRDFRELDGTGRVTALNAALRDLAARFAGRPLAGILLFTDGNATDLPEPLPDWPGLPPVYPVLLGRPGAVTDLALDRIRVNQTVFEDAPMSVQADVAATGFAGETITARLVDRDGAIVQQKKIKIRKREELQTLLFQWKPAQPGLSFYRLEVAPESPSQVEATPLNNSRTLAVNPGHGPHRILYVAGRPNWEYKFLQRALLADDQLHLVGLIRVALREPKFDFRGRAGETGNPLFRGFSDQSREEVDRYDQPVLIRLNTRDELELRSGFPRTAEELYAYRAIVIDDLEAAFFTPEQTALLQRFVSERGGGLLMLGGMESLQQGGYARTPVGDLLPVYLDRSNPTAPPSSPVILHLAREGWLQPWARLRNNETDENLRRHEMPGFQVLNPIREVKPGASIIANATDPHGTEYPALVTQQFGRGRTAVLALGDLWRWGMQNPETRRDLDKSWRQLLRWIVADVPERIEVATLPAPENATSAVLIQVRVRDERFQPVDDADVALSIHPALIDPASSATNTTNSIQLRAEPSLTEPGVYEATFAPRFSAGYQVTASVTGGTGTPLGKADAGWSSDLAGEEFRSLQPNTQLMQTLARRTGGEVLTLDRLPPFVRDLPSRQAPVMESWTAPAWHTPILFALALACLIAEWGLRRSKGLP